MLLLPLNTAVYSGGYKPVDNISFENEKHSILVVSEEPRVLAETKMRLMKDFDINISAASEYAIGAMEKYHASAVIIHTGESGAKGFSGFDKISEFARKKNVPIIVLTETDSEYGEVAALQYGADDYVIKREGSAAALIYRLNMRIRASETKKMLDGKSNPRRKPDITPEEILCGKTILITDDVEINREILAAMFSEIDGLNLEFAVTGKDAVDKFRANPSVFSLILMDVQMPEMDGIEAASVIRSLDCENAGEVPIVALTASVREEGIAQCLEAGMNGFIEKPPDYNKLIRTVADYCI